MPEIATTGKPHNTTSRDEVRSERGLPRLQVHYYRQMKPQRVCTVEVSWQKSARPPQAEVKEVTLRLIAAGAQVLPVEQALDSARPDSKAVFYVTPLVRGWLRNQKLEVLAQGHKIQEIPLATKVVSQRATWILLLLTFLVPWFIAEFIEHSPLTEEVHLPDGKIMYLQIAKEVKDHLRENLPNTPALLKGTAVEKGLLEARSMVADGYQHLVQVCRIEPIAFYAGCVMLTLTVISAYLHRPKCQKATGKPLPAS